MSRREEFWLDLTSPRLYSLLLNYGPLQTLEIDLDSIAVFAKLVGVIVDFKSPFTATHSTGVSHCAERQERVLHYYQIEVDKSE